jgi:hypothetical protein
MKKKYIEPQIVIIKADTSILAGSAPKPGRYTSSEDSSMGLPDGPVTSTGNSDEDDDEGGSAAKRWNDWGDITYKGYSQWN